MFVREYSFTVFEHDADEPWIIVGQEHHGHARRQRGLPQLGAGALARGAQDRPARSGATCAGLAAVRGAPPGRRAGRDQRYRHEGAKPRPAAKWAPGEERPCLLTARRTARLHPTRAPRGSAWPPACEGTRYRASGVSSTLTDPMASLWRAVRWRLTYGPRFLRHYRNRRQIGSTPTHAFRSARERMRKPDP